MFTERSPMDGVDNRIWIMPFSASCCVSHHLFSAYVNKPKALVTGEGY